MIKNLMVLAIVLSSILPAANAYASGDHETPPVLRLSLLAATVNDTGTVLMSGRYGGAWGVRAGFWTHDLHLQTGAPHRLAGIDHIWTDKKWHYGIGAVWIDNENEVNGTRWNFDLDLAYDLPNRFFVEFLHFSHGSKVLGIKKDLPNLGWNLFGLGLTF